MVSRASLRRATTYAATLAAAYVVGAGVYIAVSGRIAATFASSLEDLQNIELYKGMAFVLVTGLALFALSRVMFQRLLYSADEVARGREVLLRAEQQSLPGLLAASIAHDFKNSLAVARTSAELLEEEPLAEDRDAIVADLRTAIDHASALAIQLSRAGSSAAAGPAREVDVAALVHDAVELLRHHPGARSRSLRCELPSTLVAEVYPTLVQQVVANLVRNALEAAPEGGQVLVRANRVEGAIDIEVHDDGAGVTAVDRIFEPFYTTKDRGTGLGLVSVRTCAHLHGGEATVRRSELLGGAAFRVNLRAPRRDRTPVPKLSSPPAEAP